LELSRFCADLEHNLVRLRKREYKKSSFLPNRFNVPDRADEFFVELNFHCWVGCTWARIFSNIKLENVSSVLDLCPGASPKVELGLYYSDFDGQVTAINKDHRASSRLLKFTELFKPKFKLKIHKLEFFSMRQQAADLVVGNHILDDLALDYYSQLAGIARGQVYEKEQNLKKIWQFILADQETSLNFLGIKVATVLSKIVKPGGRLLLSQYPSYLERILELKKESAFSQNLLKRVTSTLIELGFKDQSLVARRGLINFRGAFEGKHLYLLRKYKD
jgi:hypothetical protein